MPSSRVNAITESDLLFIYGNSTLINKSFVLHGRDPETREINDDRLACCTVRFI